MTLSSLPFLTSPFSWLMPSTFFSQIVYLCSIIKLNSWRLFPVSKCFEIATPVPDLKNIYYFSVFFFFYKLSHVAVQNQLSPFLKILACWSHYHPNCKKEEEKKKTYVSVLYSVFWFLKMFSIVLVAVWTVLLQRKIGRPCSVNSHILYKTDK